MKRYVLRSAQASIDLGALAIAFALAFFVRFDWSPPADMFGRLTLTLPYVVAGEYLVLVLFGVTEFSWRYVGLREIRTILTATTFANACLLAMRLGLGYFQSDHAYLRHGVIPVGALVTNTALMFLGVAGVRVLRRMFGENRERGRHVERGTVRVPTLLVGAGQCGVLMARELANRPDLGLAPVAFIDDDPTKLGTLVHGLRVAGTLENLAKVAHDFGARQVLVTIASVPGSMMRTIVAQCEAAGLPTKVIPGLYELAEGAVSVSRIRNVAIEDLLGRDAVQLELDAIAAIARGRRVMVTGAGGSIGSELCRQLLRFEPRELQLVERAENALFQIHRELGEKAESTKLVPLIGDVTDAVRMDQIFASGRPELVLHAAAHKHVPMMEWNPGEALKNNVGGTALVAELAHRHGTDRFVLISTDKAVNPTSVMGASKRVAEMYVQSLAAVSRTRFACVRFGNVLGSAGSVIPIFKEQIERGGPVTVTDPEMRRYFMTIPEACQLVLQTAAMGTGGEIFVLDMGEPVKIVDLACDLIRLSGLTPNEDIAIEFTGMRPGEKLFEEIATDAEKAEKTRHPKIFVGKTRSPSYDAMRSWVRQVHELDDDGASARDLLRRCVPEYATPATPARASTARSSRPAPPGGATVGVDTSAEAICAAPADAE